MTIWEAKELAQPVFRIAADAALMGIVTRNLLPSDSPARELTVSITTVLCVVVMTLYAATIIGFMVTSP